MVNTQWLIAAATSLAPTFGWRDLGGSAIFFTFIKNYLFGKTLRTVEYPHGDLKTISVRFSTINAIKKKIAEANGVTNYQEIKQIYRHEDNFWTEPIQTPTDIRLLNDNNWVLWTRSYAPIPSKNVNLKELNSRIEPVKSTDEEEEFVLKNVQADVEATTIEKPAASPPVTLKPVATTSASTPDNLYTDRYKISLNTVKISALNFASQCRNESFFHSEEVEGGPLTEKEYQSIVDLLLDEDSYMISLYHNFKDDPKLFVKYARKKAQDAARRAEKRREEAAKQAALSAATVPVTQLKSQPPQQQQAQPQATATAVEEKQVEQSTQATKPKPAEQQAQEVQPQLEPSDEDKRKKKMEQLIHEYKTAKNLVEEIKHPKSPQDEKKKEEETTKTATWIA